MKQIQIIFIFLVVLCFSVQVSGQQKKDTCCLLKENIIGTWQLNDSLVGSDLNQSIQFFKNNLFILNLGSETDDVRDIIKLKGKYRLDRDKMYFTIISRTIIEGAIEIADPGISLNIFSI